VPILLQHARDGREALGLCEAVARLQRQLHALLLPLHRRLQVLQRGGVCKRGGVSRRASVVGRA
jgi:hypothetical protein